MIKCEICGKELKFIGSHLRWKHDNLSISDYLKLYPDAKLSDYKRIPWNKNKKGLQKGWCKGLTKKTNKSLMSISIKQKENFRTGRLNMKGENNPMYGKKIPGMSESNRRLKPEENKKLYAEGKHNFQQPETIKNIRKSFKDPVRNEKIRQYMLNGGAIKAMLASHKKQKQFMTSIELKMQKHLDLENIKYQTQFLIQNKLYDIYIPSKNLLIECDGNYWHNYPLGTFNDKLKDEIAEDNGFKIMRFWEKDINKNINQCIQKIEGDLK